MPPSFKKIFPALTLLLTPLLAYLPAILWAGYVWDDDVHLTQNPLIFATNGLAGIWSTTSWRVQFYPLTFTTFWLQYQLHGLVPWPYHLVNVLLHIANAFLLWHLLRRLNLKAAFAIALVFALHPVNVESVAWVTERKNVLMALFFLLATSAYLRFNHDFRASGQRRDWRFYALASLAFLAALFSKTVSCTFPAAMLVLLWWKRGKITWRDVLPLLPWLIVGLGIAGYTAYLEKAVVGSVGEAWHYTAPQRLLIAGRAVWFYVATFLWPTRLAFSYRLWKIATLPPLAYLAPLAVALVLIALWLTRKRIGRGPLAAVLFFLVTLSPALGFVDYYTMIYSLVADHYVYIAAVGFFALILEPLARRSITTPPTFHALLAFVAFVLAALTWQRCLAFQNSETLWRDTLATNPYSWLGHVSLGIDLRRQGHSDQALAEFHAALAVNPHCYQAMNEIGALAADAGDLPHAEAAFLDVLRENPRASTAYANLATIRTLQHRNPEAEALYHQALLLDPYAIDARLHLANLLASEQRFPEAAQLFRDAVALNPENAPAHLGLGECLAQSGNVAAALPEFEAAARLRPDWPQAQQDLARARQFLAH